MGHFAFSLPSLLCAAKVRLPVLFSDHMVFQQMAETRLGWATKEKVTVKTSWGETTPKPPGSGRWMVIYTL